MQPRDELGTIYTGEAFVAVALEVQITSTYSEAALVIVGSFLVWFQRPGSRNRFSLGILQRKTGKALARSWEHSDYSRPVDCPHSCHPVMELLPNFALIREKSRLPFPTF